MNSIVVVLFGLKFKQIIHEFKDFFYFKQVVNSKPMSFNKMPVAIMAKKKRLTLPTISEDQTYADIANIFANVQGNTTCHEKCIKLLQGIYNKVRISLSLNILELKAINSIIFYVKGSNSLASYASL